VLTTAAEVETRALGLLTGLGDTADLVAGSLLRAGVTGTRGLCTACPVAVYLAVNLPEVEEARVSSDLEMQVDLFLAGGRRAVVPQPLAVSLFVSAFDLGYYDDLVAGGGRRG
jgi:hypothetical protein